ncbi:MAG: RNA polymerase sigma factor, partial [Anaerolineales bacterium]
LRALDSFRGDSAFTTWLYTITLNVCRRRLRQRRAWNRVLNALRAAFQLGGHASTDPEVATIQHEADARLWAAVNALGEKHRLPVILRYYHGLSIAEIARMLKLNEGTVHSRLNTARERLRAALQGDPDFTWERECEVESI